jgi:hypothetical protein
MERLQEQHRQPVVGTYAVRLDARAYQTRSAMRKRNELAAAAAQFSADRARA